jgi:acyl transferase domain-containing protein
MPSGDAQVALMKSVYQKSGLDPSETGYIEAHGTGTKVGDPIEATALQEVFGEGRTKRQPLFIGSVKSNIRHLEGASGVVSLIKTAMILEKGFVLPNCNFEKGNPKIPLDEWGMNVSIMQFHLLSLTLTVPRCQQLNVHGPGERNMPASTTLASEAQMHTQS